MWLDLIGLDEVIWDGLIVDSPESKEIKLNIIIKFN